MTGFIASSSLDFDYPPETEYQREWEQRHRARWAPDRAQGWLPIAALEPAASPARGEPHSASVIRALEVHINGRVLSPAPKETP